MAKSKSKLDYEEQIKRTYQTKGYKKLWNYYLEIVKSDYFQNKIKELRTWYQIPEHGFELKAKPEPLSWYKLNKETGRIETGIAKADDGTFYTLPPSNWVLYNTEFEKKLDKELAKICDKYSLHHLDWIEAIQWYLFYNELKHFHHTNAYNLCQLEDVIEIKKEPFAEETTQQDDITYPIAIRISPYASQRDIIDFVKKMYPIIVDAQKRYKKPEIKIGQTKTKQRQERDDFIYQNRNKTGKEIKRLVQEKFGDNLPYEYIPKIISREKKRRQKM